MVLKKVFLFFLLVNILTLSAQSKKDVLLTVAGDKVYADEFIRVFKKNRDIVADENKKTIDEYLDLFINYKLKLKQAYDLQYDTVSSYKKELAGYRQQLTLPYLKSKRVTDELLHEAFNRLKKEVNASHILVRLDPDASPEDTIKAYELITEARNKILAGMPFEEAVSIYSYPDARVNDGNLGYFSAFDMIYPFENAAFTTPVGQLSKPIRTKYGYHIVKVNAVRDSKGEVEVAQIFVQADPKDTVAARQRIEEIYSKLQKVKNFELMAKMYSDDKKSAINGGKLPRFNERKFIKPFTDVAFSLAREGDISKPFQTQYGWHIIKLLKKYPVTDYIAMKSQLQNRIEHSDRATMAGKSILDSLVKVYKIVRNQKAIKAYIEDDGASLSKYRDEMAFSINGKATGMDALIAFGSAKDPQDRKKSFDTFFDSRVLEYYKANLEETNPEFAFSMQEYRDGLLLFNILEDTIWEKAQNDTLGLRKYFENHRENYIWPRRADVILAYCTRADKAATVKKLLEAGMNPEEIRKQVNEGATINVLFLTGIMEEGYNKLPEGFKFESTGVSDVVQTDKNEYVVVAVKKIIQPEPMKFQEARGKIMNDYQDYLEKQWIARLRQKYPVKVNQKILKKIKKQQLDQGA